MEINRTITVIYIYINFSALNYVDKQEEIRNKYDISDINNTDYKAQQPLTCRRTF